MGRSHREQELLSQQIKVDPATHLALEHLQAINVPSNGPLLQDSVIPALGGGVVLPKTYGKALEE